MGGSSKGSSKGKVAEVSDADRAQMEFEMMKFAEFKKTGIPMMEAGVARHLGLKLNANGNVVSTDGGNPFSVKEQAQTSGAAQAAADKETGFNPTAVDPMGQMNNAVGVVNSVAKADASESLENINSHMTGLMNIKHLGDGQQAEVSQGLNATANQAAQQAQVGAQRELEKQGLRQSVISGAVGMGLSAYGARNG